MIERAELYEDVRRIKAKIKKGHIEDPMVLNGLAKIEFDLKQSDDPRLIEPSMNVLASLEQVIDLTIEFAKA